MDNSRLPATDIGVIGVGSKKPGQQWSAADIKWWQHGVSNVESFEEVYPCDPVIGNLQMKTDVLEKKSSETMCCYYQFVCWTVV